MLTALAGFGIGEQPTKQVITGCEKLICSLFSSKTEQITEMKDLHWNYFHSLKSKQEVEKLPSTLGAETEHIKCAYLQCHMWSQSLTSNQVWIDPST